MDPSPFIYLLCYRAFATSVLHDQEEEEKTKKPKTEKNKKIHMLDIQSKIYVKKSYIWSLNKLNYCSKLSPAPVGYRRKQIKIDIKKDKHNQT